MSRKMSLLLILTLLCSLAPSSLLAATRSAYVDPTLAAALSKTVSVIVTAQTSAQAADAVEHFGGQVTSELWLIDGVAASVPMARLNALATAPGLRAIVGNRGIDASQTPQTDNGWITDYRFPVPWDGRPDVTPSSQNGRIRLAYPVVIDTGADLLHTGSQKLFSATYFGQPYLGTDITIAVVDSGVYFTDNVKNTFAAQLKQQFKGQVDFVGDGTCYEIGQGKFKNSIVQQQGYCWTDHTKSIDPYGHGSHVSGIIWNRHVETNTGLLVGVAPQASVLSVRVLGSDGRGSYADAIEGIQYVVQNRAALGIRVMNLSLSAAATVPYFVDPLNRAVERAWAAGIVVVAAAGNSGPGAETITVPGNDPYVITVGALDGRRTAGYWADDRLPTWSASGPTLDGFAKPDVLAPGAQIASFMYNGGLNSSATATLVRQHPDYSGTADFFRMNGTSMATAVTSGVVALMLDAKPTLTPNQVKFRLMASAMPAHTSDLTPLYNRLQQGAGRIWAPGAALGNFPAGSAANQGMDINADLAHGYASEAEMAFHYRGRVQKTLSDDGSTWLYSIPTDTTPIALGAADANTQVWLDSAALAARLPTWSGGSITLDSGLQWAGGLSMGAGMPTWSGGMALWSGGMALWSGGMALWSGGMALWSGGMALWSGSSSLSATSWAADEGW